MALYHRDVYLPPTLKLPNGAFCLYYSKHAEDEAKRDRYGPIPLPAYISTNNADVIEVETNNYEVVKVVYRQRLDEKRDICLAVLIGRKWTVKTVWINERNDTHKTLQVHKYARS